MDTSTATTSSNRTGRFALVVLRGAATVFMVIAAVWAAASFVKVFTSDALVTPLEIVADRDDVAPGLPAGASVVDAVVFVDLDAGLGDRFLWWLVTDALAIAVVVFLFVLRRILADGTELFTEENATRLRRLVVLALATAVVGLVRSVISVQLQSSYGFDGFVASWDFSDLFIALALGGVLEIWRHGIALKTDQELTV